MADPAQWFSGLGPAEDAAEIADGIRNGSWVDVSLGTLGGTLDTLAMAVDPLGSLTAWGAGWLMEHVRPLREALDWLAGDPGEIATQAATWRNVSEAVADAGQRHASDLRANTAEWFGATADAYRVHAAEQTAAMEGIAVVSGAIASAVEGAGLLVGMVREIVRDLIAQFVATLAVRLPQWLAMEGVTLGLATPAVASQVASLVSTWANRIRKFIGSLLTSLRRLSGMLDALTGVLQRLQNLLRRLSRTGPTGAHPEAGLFREGDGIVRNGVRIIMNEKNVMAVAKKFGIDMRDVRFSLDKIRRGSGEGKEFYGVTMPNGEIKLARDAFISEEQLARTLAHERFHLDELRAGRAFPWKEAARAAAEVRAYAHEERWWQANKHLLDAE
ncbi:WXG100 family type VII secretion target [Actinoplanes rectilineatus]|uniref:WXG100 family type VII secretion target n=1 Tax=Actinoplanes rectilineatus TaxID=113571 RepID=UPI000AFC8E7A|nr:hypothetical protein [Actinoplanes rectilineatus]